MDFMAGLFIAAFCCASYFLVSAALADNPWKQNPEASLSTVLNGVWFMVKSVLFEELIFRGALLYLLILWLGNLRATIISAVCFGVYHWFSYNIIGNPFQMTIVFFMTSVAGLAFAWSFAITRSLYLPVALHLGWNIVNAVVFSTGQFGESILVQENNNQLQGIPSLVLFLFQMVSMPLVVYLYLRSRKPVDNITTTSLKTQ